MENITDAALAKLAVEMTAHAYSPYSDFAVGAALLTADGEIYRGCNIENSSFTPTVCAERVAFFEAVREGKRKFSAIAVAGGKRQPDGSIEIADFTAPCGVCRQVMREFCEQDFRIILTNGAGDLRVYTLAEILPASFSYADL